MKKLVLVAALYCIERAAICTVRTGHTLVGIRIRFLIRHLNCVDRANLLTDFAPAANLRVDLCHQSHSFHLSVLPLHFISNLGKCPK